jgi:CrcB protein
MKILFFALGAGIGAPTRYVIDTFFRSNYRFPIGILIVNVFGSFLMGVTWFLRSFNYLVSILA